MKFGRILVATLATLLIAAPTIHAQDDGSSSRRRPADEEESSKDPGRAGPMLGLGAGFALQNFSNIGAGDIENSGAYNATVGYRFNARFATDLYIERYQEFDFRDGDVNGWAVGMNGRGYLMTGRYQPFLLMGINFLDMETTNSSAVNTRKTDDGPAMRFGGGLDVFATDKMVVTSSISYMLGLGEVEDYDIVMFSLGFLFRP